MSPTAIETWLKKLETDGRSPHTISATRGR
jgi:hypothetical protein